MTEAKEHGLTSNDRALSVDRPVVLATAAFLLQMVLMLAGAALARVNPLHTSAYMRYDSWNYVSIAQEGYSIGYCAPDYGVLPIEGPLRPSGANVYCGNAAWFPGYSYLIRALSLLGMKAIWAAVLNAWALRWFGLWAIASWLRHSRNERGTTILTMTAAAAFPGNIYYVTVFPMALAVLAQWLCIEAVRRNHWWQAGAAAFIAAFSYSSSWLGPAVMAVYLGLQALRLRQWPLLWRAAIVGGSGLAAVLTVFAIQYVQTGLWQAFFLNQATFGNIYGIGFMIANYAHRLAAIVSGAGLMDTADDWQAIVVLLWLLASVTTVVRLGAQAAGKSLQLSLAVSLALWVFPELIPAANYSGQVRSESLLAPLLGIFPLLPRLVQWPVVAALVLLSPCIDAMFFLEKIV